MKNTTQHTSSRFASLRSLGRGIALSSAVAVMGVGTMSSADASAAGVAHGVRYAGPVAGAAKPAPTEVPAAARSGYVIRDGKVYRA